MENIQNDNTQLLNQTYEHAAHLLVAEKRTSTEVVSLLVDKGVPDESATQIVNQLVGQISKAKKKRANKDMLYGVLVALQPLHQE